MAGARLLTRYPYNPVPEHGKLTIANAITDVTRLAGVEGDGAAYPDSSVGVWPAATNLVTNGGFETNTTGWAIKAGGETLARVTTTSKFGSACAQITLAGLLGYEGLEGIQNLALVNGTVYTAGAWVWCETGTLNLRIRVVNSASVPIATTNFVATTTPQRVSVTVTATADTPFEVEVLANGAQTGKFWVDGVSCYASAIDMPYIETDGGTASRSAGSIYFDTGGGLVTPTKGWAFARVRFGVSDAAAPSTAYGVIECNRSDGTSRTTLSWTPGADQMNAARVGGGSSGNIGDTTSITPALGDYATVGIGWSSSLIGVAANAGAFNTTANATIGGAFDRVNFGSRRSSTEFCGNLLWAVIGSEDTWDTALSVLMNSFGNNDPLPYQIPKRYGQVVSVHFNGDGTFYRRSA